MRRAYQRPPASSIALSSARLLGVRFLPALQGSSGLPTTAYIFQQTDPNNPAAIFGDKLLPDMKRNGDRYLVPGERDFVTMVARY